MGKYHQLKFPTSLNSLDSKLRHAQESVSAEPSQTDGDGEVEETVVTNHESETRPLHTRKRVGGLSEEQEARIRSLYDQFKDHKSCNHMIATAMDGDDKLTPPQVSRKLKQLGLYIPRKKRSGANMLLRDQDLNDSNTNNANASDDETLLSLMNRLAFNHSLPPADHAEIDDVDTFNHASPNGTVQAEVTSTGSDTLLDATPVKNLKDLQHQKIGIDLEDSGDEATPSAVTIAVTQGGASGRKMRMMVHEDEDEGRKQFVFLITATGRLLV